VHQDYLAGVVEGFYGQTWTQPQRLRLLQQMSDWGLNTYFYAPKDDLKHRAIWRECYTEDELSKLAEVIAACDKHSLRFIYGLSPGLDIRFSDEAEQDTIRQRMSQLIEVGVRHFALLFDDLPGKMTEADLQAFDSVAAAQCHVTNATFGWLRDQFSDGRLLFCPTPYCDRMDRWNLGGDEYLDEIGKYLLPDIDCLWTGPEIISQEISPESIRSLAARIGREPVIWDNLHANDYDLRRLFCGPYCGRPAETLKLVKGVLANPNNEFSINFVPLKTMAACLNDPDNYAPRAAYATALSEWIGHYESVRGTLDADDLLLLADCYYLPFEDGAEAVKLLELVNSLMSRPVDSWGDDYERFLDYHRRVTRIFDALTELRDRDLFYAWSRRVWELREEMGLLKSWLARRKDGEDESLGFALEHHLPHTCRGGVTAKLQQHTTMDALGRFHASHLDTNV
jgi:protein O-GlcNAcase/histone acetyltransferase